MLRINDLNLASIIIHSSHRITIVAILTLTSDFGTVDHLAGTIKGKLLSAIPDARIIDITHNIPPFSIPQVAYVCKSSYWHFPPHSFHLMLVNLFDRYPDHFLLAYHNEQYILCPNNGSLNLICEGTPERVVKVILDKTVEKNAIHIVAAMGKCISELLDGKPFHTLGTETDDFFVMRPPDLNYSDDWLEGLVIHVDNFENVVTSITRQEFEKHRRGRKFKLIFKRDEKITKISETYADVPPLEKLALFNSAGHLEIAINKGNAAGLFGLQVYRNDIEANFKENLMFYQKVRVFFE